MTAIIAFSVSYLIVFYFTVRRTYNDNMAAYFKERAAYDELDYYERRIKKEEGRQPQPPSKSVSVFLGIFWPLFWIHVILRKSVIVTDKLLFHTTEAEKKQQQALEDNRKRIDVESAAKRYKLPNPSVDDTNAS